MRRTRARLVTLFFVLLAMAASSAAIRAQRGASAPAVAAGAVPAAWERRVEQSFENRGFARVERVGRRWALTILCRGQHTAYLEAGEIAPEPYQGRYLQTRYHYVDTMPRNVACVQAPCAPVTERRIVLERIAPRVPSEVELRAATDRCEPETPR